MRRRSSSDLAKQKFGTMPLVPLHGDSTDATMLSANQTLVNPSEQPPSIGASAPTEAQACSHPRALEAGACCQAPMDVSGGGVPALGSVCVYRAGDRGSSPCVQGPVRSRRVLRLTSVTLLCATTCLPLPVFSVSSAACTREGLCPCSL